MGVRPSSCQVTNQRMRRSGTGSVLQEEFLLRVRQRAQSGKLGWTRKGRQWLPQRHRRLQKVTVCELTAPCSSLTFPTTLPPDGRIVISSGCHRILRENTLSATRRTFLQTCLILGPRCTVTGDSGTDVILSGDPGNTGRSTDSSDVSSSSFIGLPSVDLTGLPCGVFVGLETGKSKATHQLTQFNKLPGRWKRFSQRTSIQFKSIDNVQTLHVPRLTYLASGAGPRPQGAPSRGRPPRSRGS